MLRLPLQLLLLLLPRKQQKQRQLQPRLQLDHYDYCLQSFFYYHCYCHDQRSYQCCYHCYHFFLNYYTDWCFDCYSLTWRDINARVPCVCVSACVPVFGCSCVCAFWCARSRECKYQRISWTCARDGAWTKETHADVSRRPT